MTFWGRLRHFFAHVALTTYVKHVTARCPRTPHLPDLIFIIVHQSTQARASENALETRSKRPTSWLYRVVGKQNDP